MTFSYSRDPAKPARLAASAGVGARFGTPREAVEGAETVLLAVPWPSVDDVLRQAGPLIGQVLIDCTNPRVEEEVPELGGGLSGSEVIARKVPEARVVKAFNTVPWEVLRLVGRGPPGLAPDLLCGNDVEAKEEVAQLAGHLNFRPVDAGALVVARELEAFALLIAHLAYGREDGPDLTYRFGRYGGRP
ncbi:NADP oxidoreductase (plasmid) [Deinococcus aetherius]|uniref:NADP oxidoreductase n=1 Tax=Deinococcus aetherius TaxID=200252 RepID=A0ABM8AJ44_9DEIO|nr:NAD(P)-binding domain-containing protein [Deinococcus aetherius]BDP43824.1 NADP oxidoreductase [Deinococcus aetherius]